jgi:hypothetical protein
MKKEKRRTMPIAFQQVIGTVVLPAREISSPKKNTTGVSLVIDFGRPGYPDHWYASAWNLESVKDADEFVVGSEICISGDVRKFSKNGEIQHTINITQIFDLDYDDDESN